MSLLAVQNFPRWREFVSAQAARFLSGTAPTCRQSDPPDAGAAQPLVQLARCSDRRKAQDVGRLQVRSWSAADFSRAAASDPKNSAREPVPSQNFIGTILSVISKPRRQPAFIMRPSDQALPVAPSQPRSRTALALEALALRHQIAVLERSRTRRPCFRRWDRLF